MNGNYLILMGSSKRIAKIFGELDAKKGTFLLHQGSDTFVHPR
jgi:hypothetical protein